jgi:hypothetical protein
MFDWMTLSVEIVGFVILTVWVVVPIREFKGIFKRLKQENAKAPLPDQREEH